MVVVIPIIKPCHRYKRPLSTHIGYVKYDIERSISGSPTRDKHRPIPTNNDRFGAAAREGQDLFPDAVGMKIISAAYWRLRGQWQAPLKNPVFVSALMLRTLT
jgi:hypothetical protein